MTWSRLEDNLDDNLKVASFSDKAFRLWVLSIPYSTRVRTGGYLDQTAVRVLLAKSGASAKHVSELVELGGWDKVAHGYEIHDYAKYHPKDPGAAERMRRHRDRNAGRNPDRNEERNGPRNTVTDETVTSSGSGIPEPEPEPDTPPLPPPRNEASREPNPSPDEMGGNGNGARPKPETDEERALFKHLTETMHWPPQMVDAALLDSRRRSEGGTAGEPD